MIEKRYAAFDFCRNHGIDWKNHLLLIEADPFPIVSELDLMKDFGDFRESTELSSVYLLDKSIIPKDSSLAEAYITMLKPDTRWLDMKDATEILYKKASEEGVLVG